MVWYALPLAVALARAEDGVAPADDVPSEELDVVAGSPEVQRRRAEVYASLRAQGYRKGRRKGDYQVFNSETPWAPRVLVHDDGWVVTRRAPPRVHPPGRSFSDEGSPAEYLWCILAPPLCVSLGGVVVSERKLAHVRAEVLDATHEEVRALNDAVARRALSRRVNADIPADLEAIWGRSGLAPEQRRLLLFTYWDTRTDTPEGAAARDAVRAFLLGVVQTSDEPFPPEELARLNAARTSRDALVLDPGAPVE
jgi:hypothetical protein